MSMAVNVPVFALSSFVVMVAALATGASLIELTVIETVEVVE